MTVRRSLFFSLIDRYASLAIGVLSTVILARLLTPVELGAFSVSMAVLALASTMRDFGAGNYLIQEQQLTPDRIRAVWAVQLGLGVGLGALVAALSGFAASFYSEPVVQPVMLVLAINFLVNPFGSLTYASLMRAMRYDALAVMRFASTLSGAVVSIVLAWMGHGAMSLAWGSLVSTVVSALISLRYRPRDYPWMPGLKEVRRVLSFGAQLTSVSVLNTVTSSAPEYFLAKTLGMASAGYYSRANGLVALFNRLVTDAVYSVAFSLFAQEARQGKSFAAPFVRALAYMFALSWAFSAALAFLAHPAVVLLYGDQWLHSVPLTRWLAVAAAIGAPMTLCVAALTGSGQLKRLVRTTVISTVATVLAAGLGSQFDLVSLGVALTAAAALNAAAFIRATQKHVGFAWSALGRAAAVSAGVAVMSAVGPIASVALYGLTPNACLLPLVIGGLGSVVGFMVAVRVLKHPIYEEVKRVHAMVKARLAARL